MDIHVAWRWFQMIRSHNFLVTVSWSCDLLPCQVTTNIWLIFVTSHSLCLSLCDLSVQSGGAKALHSSKDGGNWLTQCHLTPILARVYWLRSRTHFHSACTECISNVLWRREFGWSSFVFSNHAFFFARKSCGRRKKACACKVLLWNTAWVWEVSSIT